MSEKITNTPDEHEEKAAQIEAAQKPSKIQAQIDKHGWRDVARELRALGYTPSIDGVNGDFIAQDDSDGNGPYVAKWLNKDQPCPLPVGKPASDSDVMDALTDPSPPAELT